MKYLILTFLFISCVQTKEVVETSNSNEDLITTCDYSKVGVAKRSPETINEIVDLINELPKPLSLPCFIESLTRPLKVNLTLSRSSAQPAVGQTSPRIFLFLNSLVLSIAPEGKGSNLLELSQMYTDNNSLKSELEFPIREPITYQTGFDRIMDGDTTTCAPCHAGEKIDNTVNEDNAFTSVALKPKTNMDLSDFKAENYQCELQPTLTYRCQLIMSLFKLDQVEEESFPAGTPKWIETVTF